MACANPLSQMVCHVHAMRVVLAREPNKRQPGPAGKLSAERLMEALTSLGEPFTADELAQVLYDLTDVPTLPPSMAAWVTPKAFTAEVLCLEEPA